MTIELNENPNKYSGLGAADLTGFLMEITINLHVALDLLFDTVGC
jgi:hypothetical protein